MRRKLAKDDKRASDVHQKSAAIALHEAGQVPQDVAVGADELKAFQNVLPQYRLICVYTGCGHDAVAFSPHDPDKKQIVIVHVDDHYHACSSLKGYRQNDHVCPYCLKGYDDQGQHRCVSEENVKFCLCCRREDCEEFQRAYPQGLKPQMKCASCGRYFYGERCYQTTSPTVWMEKSTPTTVCVSTSVAVTDARNLTAVNKISRIIVVGSLLALPVRITSNSRIIVAT